jgi:hypothetical protein
MAINELGIRGNLRLAQAEGRRFPGLLVQGDTLALLARDLREEAPDSYVLRTVQDWVAAYEEMMADANLELPY